MRDELLETYRRAVYRVHLPEGDAELIVGESSAALDCALAARRATRWAWLTAVNPRSERLPQEENDRRLALLRAELERAGSTFFAGVALDPAGDWPPEPSYLIVEPDGAFVRSLARRFAQRACLEGGLGAPARLVDLDVE